MRRANQKSCSSLCHKPLEIFSRKCFLCELHINLPVSCCFRMLWMNWEQMPVEQHCYSQVLDTARRAEGQSIFEASPNVEAVPTCWLQTIPDLFSGNLTIVNGFNAMKLSISLDRRMCHLSYQGRSIVLSLGRASPGWLSSWHSGDIKSPQLTLIFLLCNKENKHKPVAWAMQLLHWLWAWCYYVPRLYIVYCLIQKRAQ